MSKKFKVIMAVLAAVVLLSTLGVASVAMADEPSPVSGNTTLLGRVAGLLGITEQELINAFNQAREEMRAEWQASHNCTITDNRALCENRMDRLRERMQEKQERWAEKSQRWQEKKHRLMDRWQQRCFQDDGTADQTASNLPGTASGIVTSDTIY